MNIQKSILSILAKSLACTLTCTILLAQATCKGSRENFKSKKILLDKESDLDVSNLLSNIRDNLPLSIKDIQMRVSSNGIVSQKCSLGLNLGGMIQDPDKIYGSVFFGELQYYFQVDSKWPQPSTEDGFPQVLEDIIIAWNENRGPGLDYIIIRIHPINSFGK